MSATGLQMNWSAVGYTPSGGSLQALSKVDSVNIDPGGELIGYSGDASIFETLIVNNMNRPRCTVQTSNPAVAQGFSAGTVGTFTATHNDAKGATGGAIVYTMINAVVENTPSSGSHAQFGTGSISFRGYSTDGVTPPLSFARS